MWKNHKQKADSFLLFLCASFLLTGCLADKRTVDPYRDRSYTKSVVQQRASTPKSPPVSPKTIQARKAVVESPVMQSQKKDTGISPETMLPLLTLVDDRIVAYETKSDNWERFIFETSAIKFDEDQKNRIADCQSQVTNILSGYNEVHQHLISRSSETAVNASVLDDFLATERMDIGFLESDCQQIITTDKQTEDWVAGTKEKLLEERELELNEKMASGEYQEVIGLFSQLPLLEGEHPSYETAFNYGQALLRTGRVDEAASVFQALLIRLQSQDQMQREFKLMQLIADIQFGQENYDKAFNRYVDIINRYAGMGDNIDWARKQQAMISARNAQGIEVRNFAEILRGYLSYDPGRDGFGVALKAGRFIEDFPESIVLPAVNHILFESKDRAEAWFALLLQRLNVLKGEKKYQEALQVIDTLPLHEMPLDKREQLTALADELISINIEEEEAKRAALEEAMQDIWSEGKKHLRAKEYDQAIQVFATLLETSYREQAYDKITEASQLAAQEDRKKAAELFVQAGKSANRDEKVALLLQSRQLLKDILVKYPHSGLEDKVRNNLERIEQEIVSIDPALLQEAETETVESDQMLVEIGQGSYRKPLETTINVRPLGEWNEQMTGLPQN